MRTSRLLLALVSFLFLSNVYAQSDTIQGVVADGGGERRASDLPENIRQLERKRSLQQEHRLKAYLNIEYPSVINNVTAGKKQLVISGHVQSTFPCFLAEVPIYEQIAELQRFDRLIPLPVRTGRFKLKVNRIISSDKGKYDRILSKWVVVTRQEDKYVLISHARYTDSITPVFNWPELKLSGKKGLGGFSAGGRGPLSDLDELGIGSVTVNIRVAQLMRSGPDTANMPFSYNGKRYYVNRRAIQALDKTLRITSQKNIGVAGIVLIDKAKNCPDKEIGRIFQHPAFDSAGIYSMANVTSAEGLEYYSAIMDFLAHRYSLPGKPFGHIDHWIIHNEVNAGWVWTNMGEKPPLLFMNDYHKSMRIVFYMARKYNAHARVFISLTHFWAQATNPRYYRASELLDLLLNFSKKEGDFDWAIAMHPYPENLFDPKSWMDKKVDYTLQTPMITFKNIEVMDAWVEQSYTKYQGKYIRPVWLSEQGLNSKDYSEIHLLEQAAGMAYAWKKIKNLKNIKGFQYHNWVDNRREGGLRIGLRRFPDDSLAPGGIKPAWEVYKAAGTVNEDKVFGFALPVIGIQDWNEIIYSEKIASGIE